MPPEYCKKMSECCGTSMSIEEQLKQPWAKNVKRPINVGNPCEYAPTINRIDFDEDYIIQWRDTTGYEVWKGFSRLGSAMGIVPAIQIIKNHSEARCLKDLEAARTAWEAEEKRKKAPQSLHFNLVYMLKGDVYVRNDELSTCVGRNPGEFGKDLPRGISQSFQNIHSDCIL